MKSRPTKLALALVACAALAGCGAARRAYLWTTHMMAGVVAENMVPNIRPGDTIAIDGHHYTKHPVERFDIIAYRLAPENFPQYDFDVDTETIYISRVIALGGETVEVREGRAYVNGAPVDGGFEIITEFENYRDTDVFGPVTLPQGEYFLLGDNRANSMDSRFWGRPGLKKSSIVGKVVEIIRE